MDNLPKNFKSLSHTCGGMVTNDTIHLCYNINEEYDDKVSFRVVLPHSFSTQRPEKNDKISDDKSEFSNGFKIVRMENGEFAYVNEKGILLPYRYDIASDFNQYGFAMVGKNGLVSWINKNFEYFSYEGQFLVEDITDKYARFLSGILRVDQFSNNSRPLSRIMQNGQSNYIMYLDANGELAKFISYNGQKLVDSEELEYSKTTFEYGMANFDENGISFAEHRNSVLFATGYYSTFNDMINIAKQSGLLDIIMSNTAKMNEKEGRSLVKKI